MAQVFLSYDREDAPKARVVAQALEKAGHSVWWDRHIKGGAQYSKEIEAALKAADSVVVLWSQRSVDSAWVRDEAAAGRDSGRLVPVRIDDADPPLGFRQYQSIDLSGRRIGLERKNALLAAVGSVTGGPEPATTSPLRKTQLRATLPLFAILLTLAALVAGVLAWQPWGGRSEIVMAIGPADSDSASKALAHDLAIKLGALQSSRASRIRLTQFQEEGDADLVLEASADGPAHATLMLKSGRNSAILWSSEFEQPSARRADLLQQLAYTAGRLAVCASEGLDGPVRLKEDLLKTYLNACARLSEIGSAEDPPISLLQEVIRSSPRFIPAWSKLLLAEAELTNARRTGGEIDAQLIAQSRKRITEARAIDPDMPEAAIAEALLLPGQDFAGRSLRIAEAAARKPDDPVVQMILAGNLSEAGRMTKAVETVARATQLDPLSPSIQNNYVALLAYSGAFDAARRELQKAEKLWPGAASTRDAQYRFHLRYGDPKIARAIFEQHSHAGGRGHRMYLDARENPSPERVEALMAYVRERLTNMENPSAGVGFATLAFAQFNRKEEIFSTLLSWPSRNDVALISEILFRPEFAEVRRDPRFLRITQRAGVLDYWRKSGNWPDFCFEPDFPYDCKTEAAKLR